MICFGAPRCLEILGLFLETTGCPKSSFSPLFSHLEALLLYGTFNFFRKLNCVVTIATSKMLNNTNFLEVSILMIESVIDGKTSDSAIWLSPMRVRSTSRSSRGPQEWLKLAVANERWVNACRRRHSQRRQLGAESTPHGGDALSRDSRWKTDLALTDPQQ